MLSFLKPKHVMILGAISILAGLCIFALWNVGSMSDWEIKGTHIIRWVRKTFGRYGISSIYFFGGILVFQKGCAGMRSEERSRQIQAQFQQQQQQQGN